MTTAERIESAGPVYRGIVVWGGAFVIPIGAWAVHLVALAGIVRVDCTTDGGWQWLVHLVTALTLFAVAVSTLFCWRMYRAGGDDSGDWDAPGRLRFIGVLGLAVCVFNAVLILVEELYVIGLHPDRCIG